MSDTYTIKRSNNGAYYSMYHNKEFIGNYDTVYEAAQDLEELRAQEDDIVEQARIKSVIQGSRAAYAR